MHGAEWLILLVPAIIVGWIVAYSNRYTDTVASFLSGGRCAERYLLAVASNTGAIVFVATFELLARSGFTLNWWGYLTPIFGLVLGIYGFVSYRMRETRVLTLAQFFEIRYSKRFRVFAGYLGAASGLACDGIIAAIEARFFVYFLGLPERCQLWGSRIDYSMPVIGAGHFDPISIDTFIPLMALFLALSAVITLYGGFVAVLLIDCIEGMMAQAFYLLLIATLLDTFSWGQITTALGHQPAGQSLFNPFDTLKIKDFNIFFVLMTIFASIYTAGAWRNNNGYATAPLNAHEGRMGGLLGRWRDMGKGEVMLLLGICGATYLAHPDFAAGAHAVNEQVAQISQPQIQEQMRISIAIAHMLPPAVKDMFCVILLMGLVAGTGTRSQSWASIIIQDAIMPRRKTMLPPAQHLRLLKVSIVGVMTFFFVFGALFPQKQFVIMWFSVAGAIYLGGAGSVIIGGLYWKKGTTEAAWTSLIAGSATAVSGIVATLYLPHFPWNGQEVGFFASLLAIALYVVVSLLTCKEGFDMNRMLHRGKYAVIKNATGEDVEKHRVGSAFLRAIGVDRDFSRGDKIIATSLFAWTMFWLLVFLVGTIWNFRARWPESFWFSYWHVTALGIPIVITVVTSIWFTWGGLRDIRRFFERLKHVRRDVLDNGTVIGHSNAVDLALEETLLQVPIDEVAMPREAHGFSRDWEDGQVRSLDTE